MNEIRHRIEVPRGYGRKIATHLKCSQGYVSKVLAGRVNQRGSDLARNITRLAMRWAGEE